MAARPSNEPLSAIADAARHPRPVWGSPRAYVLATIAGIVGLGNVWRFPYMVGQHGGGSFVVAYLVCVVAIAIPMAALESAAGSLGRRSPVGAFRRAAGRLGAGVGWAVVALTVAILSYYLVVTGWTLGYVVDAVRGDLRPFTEFTAGRASLWLLLVVGAALLALLVRGVGAVERASRYLVPVLVLIVVALAIQVQGLDGAAAGRAFYLGVDGGILADPSTWRAAAGQSFYSVGIGQGLLIAYGSFVPAGTNLIRSTTTVALVNAAVSIVAGLLVFAVVFAFDLAPGAGSELSFTAFPRAFEELTGGAVLAVGFFALLFLAGFTSCLGAAVVVASTIRDQLGTGQRVAALLTVGVVVVLGIPSALSFTDVRLAIGGQPVLDRVDQVTGSGVIVVLGLGGAALLARRLPRRPLTAAFGAGRRSAHLVLTWAWVVPVVAATLVAVGLVV